jgi:6-phosphogluconolactonase
VSDSEYESSASTLLQRTPDRLIGVLDTFMRIELLEDADEAAKMAAAFIAEEGRAAVRARGRFTVAISGGRTPWQMLRILAEQEMPWEHVHVFQVDERVAPAGHPDRNLSHLRECLERTPLDPERIHAMPVDAPDLEAAAGRYVATLEAIAGAPPVLDLVHLGLGADGHTASLVGDDASFDIAGADVRSTGVYQGRRRMTLTYPILNRARRLLWLVTGSEKAEALARMCRADPSIPAGRVRQDQALILADRAAAGSLEGPSTRRARPCG